ncbi:uncharacterized protein C8Q71DRAFT_372064 [Rhodofomes roseus]|uniref:Uncharacterized protein n=1 Tax=Rhodofomes roseus TaxID=34475 RepID=A0ABQ8K0T0_9APHY|nr:uncharacterized protein C8Q71DRAFT_372064 [Rhodofomes roseus]KAH9830274.1 hypothetical protein C8Q71DRAFT_372064 [Rhodofomes roseus]
MPALRSPLPSGRDHHVWFNDPRFDGSFPSQMLPFLYLGNLCVFPFRSLLVCMVDVGMIIQQESCYERIHDLYAQDHARRVRVRWRVHVGRRNWKPLPPRRRVRIRIRRHMRSSSLRMEWSAWPRLAVDRRARGAHQGARLKGVCDDGIDTLEAQLGPICVSVGIEHGCAQTCSSQGSIRSCRIRQRTLSSEYVLESAKSGEPSGCATH